MRNRFNRSLMITLVSVTILNQGAYASPVAPKTIPSPFGERVLINPEQSVISDIYAHQFKSSEGQFSQNRYALLFTPGTYARDIRVGYNTQVLGLGQSPDDVTIIGALRTQDTPGSWDHGPGGLDNFWRGAENLSVKPTLGSITYPPGNPVVIPANQNVWAVSQASPLRRIHIKEGDLRLFELGWTSGGFMANSMIDGSIEAGSQQQWYTRNSQWSGKGWLNGAWNMVLANNDAQEPSTGSQEGWANFPFTWIPQLPATVEKPFLTYTNNEWAVFVPQLMTNPTPGVDWVNNGNKMNLDQFYIAKPAGGGQDDSVLMNKALAEGKSIILTPGEYNLESSLRVSSPNTVILGLGLPTINATGTGPAIIVSDVDGVRLAGFTVDAGQKTANTTLIQVGPDKSTVDHKNNPTVLSDLYCRVGGEHSNVAAKSCVTINSNDVIGDNLWLWRADHDPSTSIVPFNKNPGETGIVINGDRVLMHGLAVEHFLNYQTIWNGDAGKLYFYQSELPYDVPSQWGHAGVQGYASLKLNNVSTFTAFGVGIYSYFAKTPQPIYSDTAIEAPQKSGVHFEHLFTVYLNGDTKNPSVPSGIKHIINAEGESAVSTQAAGNLNAKMDHWPK